MFRTVETPPVWGVFVAFYQMMIIFLLPVILMSSSYYRVIKALWRSTKNMTVLTNTRTLNMEGGGPEEDGELVTRPPPSSETPGAVYQLRPFTIRTSFRPCKSQQDNQIGS